MTAVWQLQLLMLVGHQLHILAAGSRDDTEPSLSHSLTTPLVKVEGDDALLTCVVQNQQNLTLMWKKSIKDKIGTKILTANTARVTGDNRVSIIHEDGGQVGHQSQQLSLENYDVKITGLCFANQKCDTQGCRCLHL